VKGLTKAHILRAPRQPGRRRLAVFSQPIIEHAMNDLLGSHLHSRWLDRAESDGGAHGRPVMP